MDFSLEATCYRTALLLGLIRGNVVHRWAEQVIERESPSAGVRARMPFGLEVKRMLVGHLAVALGAKSTEPRVPLGAAVAAAFGLDLLWPILLLLGFETVRVHPGDTAFTNLAFDSYPWSHSLLFAAVWSGLAMLVTRRLYGSWRIGAILGALVLSHWVLDFITHRPDLPLWPAGPAVGAGLWN